jgi:hypothetical protein
LPDLDRDGFVLLPGLFDPPELTACERLLPRSAGSAGVRIFGNPELEQWLLNGPLSTVVDSVSPSKARPIRAILFNKTSEANWALGWHQDRTIAVRQRASVPAFNHWTSKSGVAHVEPPFDMMENMITARIHIDPVDGANAPLLVAPGSHRLGRIAEKDISSIVERCGTFACLASRGDVWMYRTAILHASERYRGNRARRVLQVDFSAAELPEPLEWLGVG